MSKTVTTSMTLDNWLYFKKNEIVPAKLLNRAAEDFQRWGITTIRVEDVLSKKALKELKKKQKERTLEKSGNGDESTVTA
jgi:hypothetical protein